MIKEIKRKFCDIENKSKIQEEVIKKRSDILIQLLESVSLTFLENIGQDSNIENCILKDQIIESSSLKGNKNSDNGEVNPKTVKMYGTDQNIKSSNGGKENVKLLNSNYHEEKSYEDFKEKNMNSKLVIGLGEIEIKVHKQLRSPVLLYMSLKDSIRR